MSTINREIMVAFIDSTKNVFELTLQRQARQTEAYIKKKSSNAW